MSDQQYKPLPYEFDSKGLVAAFAFDKCPPNSYLNMEGFEVRQQGALSSRLGRVAITTDGVNNFPIVNGGASHPLTLTTLSRMKGTDSSTYRYAFGYDPLISPSASGFAYRRNGDTGGAYTEVGLPSSYLDATDDISTITYRPAFSSTPYAFFASKTAMFKDSGTFNTFQQWGFLPPLGFVNAVVLASQSYTVNTVVSNTAANVAASNGYTQSGYVVTVTAATPGAFAGVQVGDAIVIASSGTGDYDGTWYVSQGPDPTNTTIQFLHYNTGLPNDGGGTIALSLATVNFTTTPSPVITAGATVTLSGTGGSGFYDGVWPVRINQSGANVTIYFPTPQSTSQSGGAGSVVFSGPTVVGNDNNYDYRMTLYNQNTGAESNPTATFVQARTVAPQGQAVLITWPLSVFGYNDNQATNFRIYRRGGTLTSEWLLIATLPIVGNLFGSFLDTFADYQIADNPVLDIDNDPPCTTALASQYNSTLTTAISSGYQTATVATATTFYGLQVVVVDTGVNQEIVLVGQIAGPTSFSAFFQLPHAAGAPIVISTKPLQAMNLAAVGFQQAFLAGDPVNPNRLYYSKIQNPEAFPPNNYVEIGVPSDPIMAVVSIRGQVFVFTQSRIYRVLSVGTGIPDPIPTGSRHGLSANFAWAIAENAICYLSYDGVYAFMADDSNPDSEQIEWLLGDKDPNLGPVDEINPALRSSAFGAYCKDEFFLCYQGVSGSTRRLIYDTVKKTWRNDSVPCNAMYFEEDTGELIVSVSGDGMVYMDRRSDWDQAGYGSTVSGSGVTVSLLSNPIPLNMQTPCLDQGMPRNDKLYNEMMLDLDTGGNVLTAQLLIDNGEVVAQSFPVLPLTSGRQQITFPVNNGDGWISKNIALQILGNATYPNGPVHLYQWHMKAAVDAEQRKTYDSWWSKMGTDEFKFVKQAYYEYMSSQPISFNVFTEGQSVPVYTFTLPASLTRVSVKVRFPAVKAKLWRWVALSAADMKLYGESFIEFKPICTSKGYSKMPLGHISAQSGV